VTPFMGRNYWIGDRRTSTLEPRSTILPSQSTPPPLGVRWHDTVFFPSGRDPMFRDGHSTTTPPPPRAVQTAPPGKRPLAAALHIRRPKMTSPFRGAVARHRLSASGRDPMFRDGHSITTSPPATRRPDGAPRKAASCGRTPCPPQFKTTSSPLGERWRDAPKGRVGLTTPAFLCGHARHALTRETTRPPHACHVQPPAGDPA
jgi:hypothetical protein